MSARPRTPRLQVGLTPGERDALQQLASSRHEPEATTAARLLRAALADGGSALGDAPRHRAGPSRRRGVRGRTPAAWNEPDERAAAIDALRARYPVELRHLPVNTSADALIGEQIAALAAWRAQLDNDPPDDPRMELAFGRELRDLGAWLQDRARRGR